MSLPGMGTIMTAEFLADLVQSTARGRADSETLHMRISESGTLQKLGRSVMPA